MEHVQLMEMTSLNIVRIAKTTRHYWKAKYAEPHAQNAYDEPLR